MEPLTMKNSAEMAALLENKRIEVLRGLLTEIEGKDGINIENRDGTTTTFIDKTDCLSLIRSKLQ